MVPALPPFIERLIQQLQLLRRPRLRPDRWLSGICLLCQQPADREPLLCSWCRQSLPPPAQACPQCGLPASAGSLCGLCRRQPPAWDQLLALGDYQQPWQGLITGLKFHHRWYHAELLGRLLAERVTHSANDWPDCLLPVPLAPRRQARRGYNQAALLSQVLGHRLGLPVTDHHICRQRHTPAQSGLSRLQRQRNLAGAFQLGRPLPDPLLSHIGIVDDVVTSGATVTALCQLLRQQGVERISVLCVCRTSLTE